MKVEGNLFAGIGIFLIPVTPIYWYYSEDWTGTTALTLTIGLCALIGFYLLFTAKRIDLRPEDDPTALIEDGAGELGFFSPHSWWPLILAGAGGVATLGIVFGMWLFALAVPIFAYAVWGMVFEYYRGEHAH
ncbi:cytochrome c oxidase subunit 4 [Sporichthya brevicatena]|uniref:Cytochrome c oxidase polypeptide 4 n=1 Tax=Sporichthya brevicatena TaxID=171442 RepID=A0ABP3SA48_9ACTN